MTAQRGRAYSAPEGENSESSRLNQSVSEGLGALARELYAAHAAGLVIIPTRADDAKRPAWTKWAQRKRQARLSTLECYVGKSPGANWGYLPGASDLVVLDVDERDHLDRALDIFGPTPVHIETGQKGWHLPYRFEGGIPSRDLRHVAGLPIEVKSQRALVVGWGSIHPKTGRQYRIVQGTPEDFARLPTFNVAALEQLIGRSATEAEELRAPSSNPDGERNKKTFAYLRANGAAGVFSSLDNVLAEGHDYNTNRNDPPLPDVEIGQICKSVWGYVQAGTCKAPKRPRSYAAPTSSELAALRRLDTEQGNYADALALLVELKSAHGLRARRGETFAIAASAMAQAEVIPGWSDRKRYLRATKALKSVGLIAQTSRAVLQEWQNADSKRLARGCRAAQYQFGGRK